MGDKIKVKKINNNLIIILPELINEEDSIYRMYGKIRELLFNKMEKKKYYPHRIHVFFQFPIVEGDKPYIIDLQQFQIQDIVGISELFMEFTKRHKSVKVIYHHMKIRSDDYYDYNYIFFGNHKKDEYKNIKVDNNKETFFKYHKNSNKALGVKFHLRKGKNIVKTYNVIIV